MIKGNVVTLQPAAQEDKRTIFEWLIKWQSLAVNNNLPSWKEFCDDYQDFFFDGSKENVGRCYLIFVDKVPVGHINYHTVYPHYNHTELDIWMKNDDSCAKGYGPDALKTLCKYLYINLRIEEFVIRPSAKNKRAVSAYQKAGFQIIECDLEEQTSRFGAPDSDDCIVMIKHANREE